MLSIIYIAFYLLMLVQGLLSIYLTLYVWEDPDRLDEIESPKKFRKPSTSFSILIPARHEKKVIGHTLKSVCDIHYPKNLIQIFIICDSSDSQTIEEAKKNIKKYKIPNADVLVYDESPINKPHALNVGLKKSTKDIVVVFDAEDEVNRDILNVVNTLFLTKNPDVIQSGVQLMNYDSNWFSPHNVLEYYFWFKSRMHFHSMIGVVPLGGNTVFFKTKQLKKIGGWNVECLTEDAEIGIRLSVNNAKILSTYDPAFITKEETPGTLGQFIKQRARWNQGFIQVLKLGVWTNYDTDLKKIFCFYTLSFPIIQSISLFATPIIFLFGVYERLPILIALFSFIPFILVCVQYTISLIALREFIGEQKLHQNKSTYLFMFITFIPYQIILSIGALRALQRELRGITNWEKTVHLGVHREVLSNYGLDLDASV